MPRVITNPEDEEIITLPTIAESWRVPTEAIEESVEEAFEQLGPFVGTDGTTAGQAGLVPAPATTDADKYLKSDGTWGEGGASAVLYDTTGQNTDGAMTQKATTDALGGKQNSLTAGTNISISSDVISATDTTYSAGSGLSLDGTEFSVDTTAIQPKLTAGTNITIDANNEISAADTTYSDFTGTDGTSAGTAGLVPAPATTDADKFLKADGTWAEAGGGGGTEVVQATGTSTTAVMSQAATTNMIYPSGAETTKDRVSIGERSGSPYAITQYSVAVGPSQIISSAASHIISIGAWTQTSATESVAVGYNARVNANRAVAIGSSDSSGTTASHAYSVALGASSATSRASEVSVGSGTSDSNYGTRYVANVTDPQLAQDAATKNYVDSIYPVGAVFTSTSATAPNIAGGAWTEIGTQAVGSSTVHYYERTA